MTLALRQSVALAPFTSWRVGGAARYFAEPTDREELVEAIAWARARGLATFVLGKGSNLLVSDAGFDGLVIRLGEAFGAIAVGPEALTAQAGASTRSLVNVAAEHDMGGLEFLSTIPGSVGGVVAMNAGAHGRCMADCLLSATLLLADGTFVAQRPDELDYRYRHSNVAERHALVVEATVRTQARPKAEILAEIAEMSRWRRQRQPQALSAGSVFTNPPQAAAGRLIEEAGLKGLTVGKAQVSVLHANFFVNLGGATASDLQELIGRVQREVHARTGIWLHPEVQGVGMAAGLPGPQEAL